MSQTQEANKTHDEETPLLSQSRDIPKEPTPLPIGQIVALLALQLAEPIAGQSILPFINQLISELGITGGDDRKVGYYAGIIQSMYYAAEAVTVLQWSRLSDHVGRKPVLLSGILGMTISTLCFGLSRTYWTLVISRSLCGALNGNIGVMKSMMAELTDETNMAQGFALFPVTWAVGATIGPFIGGILSRPQDHFPEVFKNDFWKNYPYFLPCAGAAAYSTTVFILGTLVLKETVTKDTKPLRSPTPSSDSADTASLVNIAEGAALEHEIPTTPPRHDKPLPLLQLLTRPVVLSISNYAVLALVEIALSALLPLFYSTPIELGGLGLTPAFIGICMGVFGLLNGCLQFLFFARAVHRFGPKRVFVFGMSMFIPIFSMFPLANALARQGGLSLLVWAVVFMQLVLMVVMDMSYGCVFMYISTASPNKRSLGATNGLAQTLISVQRAIGPAISTSLFAFSLQKNIMGGNFVYVVLIGIALLSLLLAAQLPRGTWKSEEEN
ncbi:MFS general substrate transporter [Artomyces pyxidatus]|uniref:MFS general substrate transporter n=1 Tax=Artomyces pyxidatus TaxID=48021 RepID=A0ACB8SRA5_9AGAM|nr:MFS general substrate transporter [Artomyces pyxidatus]